MHSITFTIPALAVDIVVAIPAYLLVGVVINFLQTVWIKAMTTKGAHRDRLAFTVLGYALVWPFLIVLQILVKLFKIDLTGIPHISWDMGAPRGGYKVSKEIKDSLQGLKVGDKVQVSYIPSGLINKGNTQAEEIQGVVARSYGKLGLKKLTLNYEGSSTGYFLNESGKLIRKIIAPVVKL